MTHHSTTFSQILELVPRHEFASLARKHGQGVRSDAMSRWTQFVAMSTAQPSGRASLRDIESTLESQKHLRYHLGSGSVRRTTLSRANQDRPSAFYEELFGLLYARCRQAAPRHKFAFKRKLFSLDSSLLDVSLKLFPQTNYNRMKAAFKLHVGLDHDGLIPAFAAIPRGRVGDQAQAKLMRFPKGSVLVFDRGYSDYRWHNQLTGNGIYWVTRLRGHAKYRVLERRDVAAEDGITSDQLIAFTSHRASTYNLRPVRRIGFRDRETGKHYTFYTNHMGWDAKTIADIYKQRWQVELFFKWIKQNLKIKSFLGNNDNAVMTQVMIALCLYLILSFLKFQSGIAFGLQQMSRLIHVNLFARRSLIDLLKPPKVPDKTALQGRLL